MAVVYFGLKVAWIGLKFPRWFIVGSIVHIILLIVSTLGANVWALNAFLDMGEKELVGKGYVSYIKPRTDPNPNP